MNEEADSDGPLAAVLVDDGTLVLDEEFDVALDDEPQAASAAAVIATSETAPARLMVDFRSDRRREGHTDECAESARAEHHANRANRRAGR